MTKLKSLKNIPKGAKRPKPRRAARIVSVNVAGAEATDVEMNITRADLMEQVVNGIRDQKDWPAVDAVLFPGGTFFSPQFVGDMPYAERKRVLQAQPFAKTAMKMARKLSKKGHRALVIAGVDSIAPNGGREQLCVAFSPNGVAGIGRKVFPTNEDSNGKSVPPMICYEEDYNSPHRTVQLANGSNALLCACYDMFGISETPEGQRGKVQYIRYLNGKDPVEFGRDFADFRKDLVGRWSQVIDNGKVDLALTAIHHFERPGRDCFYQRHGIASASARLGGGLAIGAANFSAALPRQRKDGSYQSPLAAFNVAAEHLNKASHRQAETHDPQAEFSVQGNPEAAHGKTPAEAVVRLFLTRRP